MLFFPEIRLKKICDSLFKYLKENLKQNITSGTENQSILYLYFHEDTTDLNISTNYLQAKEIFLREESDPRYVQISPVFDRKRSTLPTIFVTIPQDSESLLELGDIEGSSYSEILNNKLERGYQTNFGLITISDNINETLIINYVLRALLLGSLSTLQLFGFISPSFSVQDLSPQSEIVPSNAYSKGLLMTATYIEKVPELESPDKINEVIFDVNEILY